MTRPRAQGILSGPPARTCFCRELLPRRIADGDSGDRVAPSLRVGAMSGNPFAPSFRRCKRATHLQGRSAHIRFDGRGESRTDEPRSSTLDDACRIPGQSPRTRITRRRSNPAVLHDPGMPRVADHVLAQPTVRSIRVFADWPVAQRVPPEKPASAADAGFRTRGPTPSPGLCKTIFNVLLHMDCIVAKLEVDIPYQYPSRLCSKERNNGAHQCRGACRG